MSVAGPTDLPLAGLRVLELATLYAAPQVGAMLGDLGADVVKVEPPGGDPMRRMGVVRGGVARHWSWVARHKRSIVLDLEAAEDRATFDGLVGAADVLVENLTPTIRDRWGCDYERLAARNPGLVVVSVSCYGRTGPYADRPGAGTLAEAFAGLAHLTGEADGPPTLASVPLGDTLTAFAGVIGALAGCWARERGSAGRLVDVAMYEPVLAVLGGTLAAFDPADPPHRSGSRVRGGVPRNVYRTRDGAYVAVSGTTDPQVSRLLPLLGRDGPDDRARFGRSDARLRHADELDGLVADFVAARDRDAVVAAFLAARIPVAPVNDLASVLADEHIRARGSLAPMLASAGPALGADREAVVRDWLGPTG
ncbi:MAG TPA: CoA transferase [Acidimicrobiia bacterium]|nr:CoA transferase [Acidimicrobiia bacterium]